MGGQQGVNRGVNGGSMGVPYNFPPLTLVEESGAPAEAALNGDPRGRKVEVVAPALVVDVVARQVVTWNQTRGATPKG